MNTIQRENRINILGVGVSAINLDMAVDMIESWISEGGQHYVCVTGVHGIIESQRDEKLKVIHNNAGLVTPDGMPLVWLSKLKGYINVNRVYGPDLMLAFCEYSVSKGYRHFFYGGSPGIPEKLAVKFEYSFPGIQIVGTYSPPFRQLTDNEVDKVVDVINNTRPDIIWVGLSTPKQELWMAEHQKRLTASALIGVGAAFDFHAGSKRQSPRWIQSLGMEWFFRLLSEPKRLWKRYLINNPTFIWLVLLQTLGFKEFPIDP